MENLQEEITEKSTAFNLVLVLLPIISTAYGQSEGGTVVYFCPMACWVKRALINGYLCKASNPKFRTKLTPGMSFENILTKADVAVTVCALSTRR